MNQVIRIIGGLHRGKKLQFPSVEGLRPTPDRVRETLFNWLMHDIRGACCLDAFAGSGALGFEAFSRGAKEVTFIESSEHAFTQLKKNISLFNSPNLRCIKTDSMNFLQNPFAETNLVFLDPPFGCDYLPRCLDYLYENNSLIKNGLVYVESPNLIEANPLHWHMLKSKKAGQVFYALFRKL